jgi:hypothetical protein
MYNRQTYGMYWQFQIFEYCPTSQFSTYENALKRDNLRRELVLRTLKADGKKDKTTISKDTYNRRRETQW